MERKSSKQLYNKLLSIYTAVLLCVVLFLMAYFLNSLRNRYLERSLENIQRMQEEAVQYIADCMDIADYLHEELYKSDMEMQDLIHYLTDDPEAYQKYRLDAYSRNYLLDYNGIEDFAATAFDAYPELKRFALVSYSKGDLTSFNKSKSVYHTENGSHVLERIRNENMADPGEFSFLKEIRDPVTMQGIGAMVLTFDAGAYQKICNYYNGPELIVYNESGMVIYDSCGDCAVDEIELAQKEGKLDRKSVV